MFNHGKLKHSCMTHQDSLGYLVEVNVHYGICHQLIGRESSKPAREILHLPRILRHYLYMPAQPSSVGLEPSRAAKFCSASSSPTIF